MSAKLAYALIVLALGGVIVASLCVGKVWLTPAQVLASIVDPRVDLQRVIVVELRLPRVILALLIGAVLGLSGAVLQGLLRNPLAEPGLLGISSAASLGAVIAIYYGLAALAPLAAPALGLLGALLAAAMSLYLARTGGTLALILAGAATSSIAAAGVSLALNLAPNPYAAYEIMTWLLGSLTDRNWTHVGLAAPLIALSFGLLFSCARALDALALGEAQAESLGASVARTRFLALAGTAMGVGAATAVAGAVSFVGLIAPHLARPLAQYTPSRVLLPAALIGSLIVAAADLATRLIAVAPEIKLGVFISLIGAPFLLWLIVRMRGVLA